MIEPGTVEVSESGGLLAAARARAGGAGAGLYGAVLCALVLGASALVGLAVHEPWLFPSLGPTLMVVSESPTRDVSGPRNIVVGHLVGIGAGWCALAVTGLLHAPSAVEAGLSWRRLLAAVLSLAVTAFVLQVIRTPHPPAGASTLIVSLGILTTGPQLLSMVLAVLLVTALATLLNVLARVRQAEVPHLLAPTRVRRR